MTRSFRSCLNLKGFFPFVLLTILSLTQFRMQAQDCLNDTIPPVAKCKNQLTVFTNQDDLNDCFGPAGPQNSPAFEPNPRVCWVNSALFNDGSFDDCNNIRLTVRRGPIYGPCILNLNATNGHSPCNDVFPDFPSEFERAISEQDSIKFYSCQAGQSEAVILRAYQVDDNGVFMLHNGMPIYSECNTTVTVQDTGSAGGIINGIVFIDTLNNCSYDGGEQTLDNWRVKVTGLVTGQSYETLTNINGQYSVYLLPEDVIAQVTLVVPFNFGQNCPSVYTVQAVQGQLTIQNIPVHLESNCPLLKVDIGTNELRSCFHNTYEVEGYNLSDQTVNDVHVEVTLDPYMSFDSSSVAVTALGNNVYSFQLGALQPAERKKFKVHFGLSCNTPFGITHCVTAHIFPDSLCEYAANWSGADLEVHGTCDGDSVRLSITNIGIGDMTQAQDFVVVEDVLMYLTQPFQLNHGDTETIAVPANGATWRMETPEVPNHPWGGIAAAAVEGCGGLNMTGLVNMFPLDRRNPFESIDCLENSGSYDPNDKEAFPKGYLDEHYLKANTDIEYRIRFQNTGTASAITVVVLDTLSQYLDASSVRPGISSHDYSFSILDGNVLRFQFNNILLPDSNENEAASHGFFKFKVSQKPNNPEGTLIQNDAAIYFDFNAPVITNSVFHTIGDHFVLVNVDPGPAGEVLKVYPNPSAGAVYFELPKSEAQFELRNSMGQLVRTQTITQNTFRFERGDMASGAYFFRIQMNDQQVFTGKLLLK